MTVTETEQAIILANKVLDRTGSALALLQEYCRVAVSELERGRPEQALQLLQRAIPEKSASIAEERSFVVWSEEHSGWWPQSRVGYWNRLERAGRFTAAEATEIVVNANAFCEPGKWNEIAIPDPMWSSR